MTDESFGEATTEKSSFEKTTIRAEHNGTSTVTTSPSNPDIILNDADELESGAFDNDAKRGYWSPKEEHSVITALIDQLKILRSNIDDAFSQTNPVLHVKTKLPSRKFPFRNTSKTSKRRRTANSFSPQSTEQNDQKENSQHNEASASAASSSTTSVAAAEIDARMLLDVFFSSKISWSLISCLVRTRGSNQCRNHW